MHLFTSQILYIISILSWAMLTWKNPIVIFLSACYACLTVSIYRQLKNKSLAWCKALKKNGKKTRINRLLIRLSAWMPVSTYTIFIFFTLAFPVSILVALVSPQAVAGFARLRELVANRFQLPPKLAEYVDSIQHTLSEIPGFEKFINDSMANIDALFSDMVGGLVSNSFSFLGGAMNVIWLIFLFITLTILFSAHSSLMRSIFCRALHMPSRLVLRFIHAIKMALRGVVLGIVLVALVQGFLCGIGFAAAGVRQPAFWGMLATMVAPIPMVGTALVWFPLCISLWFSGKTVAAFGLAVWGGVFVSLVDNILRPFFLRQGIKTSFFVLILAILCGLNIFGSVGLVAGPVILAIALQAYEEANNYYRSVN